MTDSKMRKQGEENTGTQSFALFVACFLNNPEPQFPDL